MSDQPDRSSPGAEPPVAEVVADPAAEAADARERARWAREASTYLPKEQEDPDLVATQPGLGEGVAAGVLGVAFASLVVGLAREPEAEIVAPDAGAADPAPSDPAAADPPDLPGPDTLTEPDDDDGD